MSLNQSSIQTYSWQKDLIESVTSIDELIKLNLVNADQAQQLKEISEQYRIRIPQYYLSLIDRSNLDNCPIRKQAIPSVEEIDPILPKEILQLSQKYLASPNPWLNDAIGDIERLGAARITHRYQNRAIIHVSSLCAMYCRFCFRKTHLNEKEKVLYEGSLEPALQYLTNHPEIKEVILTGGDPLSLNDFALDKLISEIRNRKHIKVLRIHSRMAVTMPSRLTDDLIQTLSRYQSLDFKIYLVSHFNHPKECTKFSLERLYQFSKNGITVLNQTVLLRTLNDDAITLTELFQKLYNQGILSFHLHHPDWTKGTFYFRNSIRKGLEIIQEFQGKLSGPAKPEYVLDLPKGFGKINIQNENLNSIEEFKNELFQASAYMFKIKNTRTNQFETTHYLDASYLK